MVDSTGIFDWLVRTVQRTNPSWTREQAQEWILAAKARHEPGRCFGAPAFGKLGGYQAEYTLRDHLAKQGLLEAILKGEGPAPEA